MAIVLQTNTFECIVIQVKKNTKKYIDGHAMLAMIDTSSRRG